MSRARRSPLFHLLSPRGAFRRAALALLIVASSASCSVFEPVPLAAERDDLARARRLWQQQHALEYRYVYARSCECPPETTRPVVVLVNAGLVDSVNFVTGGTPVTIVANAYPTVDDLFAVIEDAYARRAAAVHVRYDPTLGYPREISVDWNAATVDDEFVVTAGGMVINRNL